MEEERTLTFIKHLHSIRLSKQIIYMVIIIVNCTKVTFKLGISFRVGMVKYLGWLTGCSAKYRRTHERTLIVSVAP